MSKTFRFFIALSIFTIHQAHCATVDYDITLNPTQSNLELNCTYTLAQNETLYEVIMKKDSDIFVKFNSNNKASKYQDYF